MNDRVARYMAREGMPGPGSALLVGVSGGVDSMVLLHILLQLGYRCEVAHVDHGLRGAESDADRDFVVTHAMQLGIDCHVRRVDVATLRERPGISTQMGARMLRLDSLKAVAVERGLGEIALAHHADDAVETFFLHLLRGMGLRGWGTIPVRSGIFIRPLLQLSRKEIMTYAQLHGIPFREDGSNADPTYLRGRVRHQLLPVLEEFRPGAGRVLRRDVAMLRSLAAFALAELDERLKGHDLRKGVPCHVFADHTSGHLLLQRLIGDQVAHPSVVDNILAACDAPGVDVRFRVRDGWLIITQGHLRLQEVNLSDGCPEVEVGEDLRVVGAPLVFSEADADGIRPGMGEQVAWLDRDRLTFPLRLRGARPADQFIPLGMTGHKRLMDLLAERKVPIAMRILTPVLCDANGEVVWLVGHRIADRVKVRPDTKRVLRVDWSPLV
ncbi:MAG: tRNA lysidine(34) synthetase TilS [Flavobacteriales bacterium]|nr:tRNA lysidine(34) synthetase TilS [Flavobacteriales bacterium]